MRHVIQTKADSSLNTARACLYKVNDMCVILCKTQSSRLHFIKILEGSFQTISCRYATRKTPSFIERRLSRERKRFLTSRALHAILSSSIPPSHPRRGRLAWLIGRGGLRNAMRVGWWGVSWFALRWRDEWKTKHGLDKSSRIYCRAIT